MLTELKLATKPLTSLDEIGTREHPLRVSSLAMLVLCQLRELGKIMSRDDMLAGEKADTGSAVHHAVSEWHDATEKGRSSNRRDAEELALDSMRKFHLEKFPNADLERAELEFISYARDRRNHVDLVMNETALEIKLEPHYLDHTKKPIWILGHCDQVRNHAGRLDVWDLKSSGFGNSQLSNSYSLQVAAYAIGASMLLKRRVDPGAIISLREYTKGSFKPGDEPEKVFVRLGLTLADAVLMMEPVKLAVAMMRRGDIVPTPSMACSYCSFGGVFSCVDYMSKHPLLSYDYDNGADENGGGGMKGGDNYHDVLSFDY